VTSSIQHEKLILFLLLAMKTRRLFIKRPNVFCSILIVMLIVLCCFERLTKLLYIIMHCHPIVSDRCFTLTQGKCQTKVQSRQILPFLLVVIKIKSLLTAYEFLVLISKFLRYLTICFKTASMKKLTNYVCKLYRKPLVIFSSSNPFG
jgi:hypothetical protein